MRNELKVIESADTVPLRYRATQGEREGRYDARDYREQGWQRGAAGGAQWAADYAQTEDAAERARLDGGHCLAG